VRRPENRNYLDTAAQPDVGITTQEKFLTHVYLSSGAITNALTVGVCYDWPVPAQASLHYVWIASGAYIVSAVDVTCQWFVQGQLNFFRGGRQVGEFLFGDCSNNFGSALQKKATRTLTRTRGDAAGSWQPVLRYQAVDASALAATYERDNLDMGCFSLPVRCDRISYEIKSYSVTPASADVHILTGARLVSLP
jgi:hypothetical protein